MAPKPAFPKAGDDLPQVISRFTGMMQDYATDIYK